MPQSTQLFDVAGACFMIHDACIHKQRSFKSRVVDDVEHCGDGSHRATQPQQERNQSEMADRRKRQQPF